MTPEQRAFGSMGHAYDGLNRLRRTTYSTSNDGLQFTNNIAPYAAMGAGVTEDVRYDALGRRIWQRADYDAACSAFSPSLAPASCMNVVERTVYDGDQVLVRTAKAFGKDQITGAPASYVAGALDSDSWKFSLSMFVPF